MSKTVVVVDDDDLSLRGIDAVLSDDIDIEVVGLYSHDQAMAAPAGWCDVDVAIVDASDERRDDDHFPGAAVVERIRSARTSSQTTVVAITGHFFDDAVRVRMREAGADLLFHRTEIQEADQLRRVVRHPEQFTRAFPGPLDPEAMFRLGINPKTRLNAAVRFAQEQNWLDGRLDRPGRRSRSFDKLRKIFVGEARLHTVNVDGRPPDRDQAVPSRPQIARALAWATRVKRSRSS